MSEVIINGRIYEYINKLFIFLRKENSPNISIYKNNVEYCETARKLSLWMNFVYNLTDMEMVLW